MKSKAINQCDCYVGIWFLYSLFGALHILTGITTVLQVIAIIWAFILCPSRFLLRKGQPALLNIIVLLTILHLFYGFAAMIFGPTTLLRGEVRPPHIYIRTALGSFLPIIVFYEYTVRGVLTESRIKKYFWILLALTVFNYFKSYKATILALRMQGNDVTEITNNVGYNFLVMIPMVLFFYRKPLIQYILLFVIMGFVVSSMKRGAILIGVFCFAAFLYKNIKNADNIKTKYLSVLLGITAVIGSVFFVNHMLETSDYFNKRIQQTEKGYSSHRDELYAKIYHAIIYDESYTHALVGRGADSTIRVSGNYAHQDWLEVACNNGLLGLTLMLAFYICFGLTVRKGKEMLAPPLFLSFELLFFICVMLTMFSMSLTSMGLATTMLLGFFLCFA